MKETGIFLENLMMRSQIISDLGHTPTDGGSAVRKAFLG